MEAFIPPANYPQAGVTCVKLSVLLSASQRTKLRTVPAGKRMFIVEHSRGHYLPVESLPQLAAAHPALAETCNAAYEKFAGASESKSSSKSSSKSAPAGESKSAPVGESKSSPPVGESKSSPPVGESKSAKPASYAECDICAERMNSTRRPVACGYCAYEICLSCFKQHVNTAGEHAKCLNAQCKATIADDVIMQETSTVFYRGWLDHRFEVILKQEDIWYREMEAECDRIIQVGGKNVKRCSQYYAELEAQNKFVPSETCGLKTAVRKMMKSIRDTDGDAPAVRLCITCSTALIETADQRMCPTCNVATCKRCHVEIPQDAAHACDANELATMKLLERDTKACPKCKALIHKTDGCDQMWCVQCHTPFSWRTLQIETGRIHNPMYYEWLRSRSVNGEIPRDAGAVAREARAAQLDAGAAPVVPAAPACGALGIMINEWYTDEVIEMIDEMNKIIRVIIHAGTHEGNKYTAWTRDSIWTLRFARYLGCFKKHADYVTALKKFWRIYVQNNEAHQYVQTLDMIVNNITRMYFADMKAIDATYTCEMFDEYYTDEDMQRRLYLTAVVRTDVMAAIEMTNGHLASIAQRFRCSAHKFVMYGGWRYL